MSKNKFVPTPAICQMIVRERRKALCSSARAAYDANPVTRWWINTLWVISSVDQSNGRRPFRHAGMA